MKRNTDIRRLSYRPTAPYRLDLEIFSASDLRRRGSREKMRTTHRYEFHMLVCVTHGACSQVVDFKHIPCEPGSLLVLRPGQAHNFGHDEEWDGWIILFRPEFVLPTSTTPSDLKLAIDLKNLPEQLFLLGNNLQRVTDSIAQMRDDAQIEASFEDVHALLRHHLHALLTRLIILHGPQRAQESSTSPALQCFKRFHQLVEERFSKWHQVAEYSSQLGYTEKSLTRATTAAMGMTAKTFIGERIHLEAKRLLVHTDLPVAAIAEKLGFAEATNFIKFFKRGAGCTPAKFRRQHVAEDTPCNPRS